MWSLTTRGRSRGFGRRRSRIEDEWRSMRKRHRGDAERAEADEDERIAQRSRRREDRNRNWFLLCDLRVFASFARVDWLLGREGFVRQQLALHHAQFNFLNHVVAGAGEGTGHGLGVAVEIDRAAAEEVSAGFQIVAGRNPLGACEARGPDFRGAGFLVEL